MDRKKKIDFFKLTSKNVFLVIIFYIFSFIVLPKNINAINTNSGSILFKNHCAGCHINGGNIIRRSKNLRIESLNHNGINDPETIASIARKGIGIMDGYEKQLGENGDKIVATWIWEQAQKAWVQE